MLITLDGHGQEGTRYLVYGTLARKDAVGTTCQVVVKAWHGEPIEGTCRACRLQGIDEKLPVLALVRQGNPKDLPEFMGIHNAGITPGDFKRLSIRLSELAGGISG